MQNLLSEMHCYNLLPLTSDHIGFPLTIWHLDMMIIVADFVPALHSLN